MELPPVNKYLEELLAVPPDSISLGVFIICVVLFLSLLPWKYLEKMREIAPTLMVSAGIIGTFWGTFIALAAFQTSSSETGTSYQVMVESIPNVLSGMKSAFITSLFGLASAFILRFFLNFMPKAEPKRLPIEKESIALLQEIKEGIVGEGDKSLSSQLSTLQAEYRDSAQELKQAISGEGDSSVTTQLIKLRNDNVDGFKKLDAQLNGLAETIRDSLVESLNALITELREAIVNQLSEQLKETNTLLREQLSKMLDRIEEALIKQFGETFKQFNEATQAIQKWQEEHRQHVEQLTGAFELTAKGIERIRADSESIPATMAKLQEVMGELDERLKAFADMKSAAEQSFPIIKEHLDAIGADMQQSASGFSGLEQTITDTYMKASELAQQHIELSQQHIEGVGAQINSTAQQVAATAENMMSESQNASNQHRDSIRNIVDEVERAAQRGVEEMRAALEEMAQNHVTVTNNAMTEIANRWGENVVGISDKMADVIRDVGGRR